MNEVLAAGRQLRSFVDAREQVATLNLAQLAVDGRSAPVTETLRDSGRSTAEARAAGRRAEACASHPGFHDALAAGAIATGHVDALARATARLSDVARSNLTEAVPDLVAAAKGQTVEEFARTLSDAVREASGDDGLSELERQRARRRVSRHTDADTGMRITRLELDPLSDEQLWSVINATVRHAAAGGDDDGRSWEHRTVDTIVALVTRPTSTPTTTPPPPVTPDEPAAVVSLFDRDEPATAPVPGSSVDVVAPVKVPEISVLIDYDVLCFGVVAAGHLCETVDGHPLPIDTIRRLACDADLLPIVLNGDSRPLDVGRSQRLATIDQRRALAAIYATCAIDGCTVPFRDCVIHHTIDWATSNGPTDLALLMPLCTRDHHLVHEGGWHLELHPDRTITLTRPDGQIHYHGPSPNRRRPPPPAVA